jgi:hypothetical protein
MPLSSPDTRKHVHTRTIECRGYEREDGLWDIEGHLVDVKTYGFEKRDLKRVEAGEPVHEMWLRLTIDGDMEIHGAEAATDHAPTSLCSVVTPTFAGLKGIRIGPGWRRKAHAVVGGVKGCTHLVELLGPLATVAYQTLWPSKARRHGGDAETSPPFLDTCYAYASDGELVKEQWPKAYTGTATR